MKGIIDITNDRPLVVAGDVTQLVLPVDLSPLEQYRDQLLADLIDPISGSLRATVESAQDESFYRSLIADIRKKMKSVDRIRIDKSKEYREPVTAFENSIKAISAEISDYVINPLDALVREYDQKRIEKRKKLIESILKEAVALLPSDCTERPEQKEKYLNRSTKDSDIEDDIKEQCERINERYEQRKKDIEIIKQKTEIESYKNQLEIVLDSSVYVRMLNTHELTTITDQIERDAQAQKERIAEYAERVKAQAEEEARQKAEAEMKAKAAEEAERIAAVRIAEERARAEAEAQARQKAEAEKAQAEKTLASTVERVERYIAVEEPEQGEAQYTWVLAITTTVAKKNALKAYMDDMNIRYEQKGGIE